MSKINLDRFTEEKEIVMPVVEHWGKFQGRLMKYPIAEDGWYKVKLPFGVLQRKATPLEIVKAGKGLPVVRVYAMGGEGIAVNFDNLLKKGLEETVSVNFLDLPAFEVAKAIEWEDGRFYFYEPDPRFQRTLLMQLKNQYETDQPLAGKGITPELRYYYLLLSLQKQSLREIEELEKLRLTELEKQKRIKEFQNSFQGRLKDIIEKADGELIRYYKSNATSYMVHWRIKETDKIIKSTIRDNFRILDLGFCASGADRQHSIQSAIQLAKVYGRNIYITRE